MSRTVEVIVVSYGSAPVLGRLLASLEAHLPGTPLAIREHSAAADALKPLDDLTSGYSGPVRLEHDPKNPGFGAGCNALARGSTADFLAFLNPDTELITWPWSDTDPPPDSAVIGPVMVDSGPPGDHYGTDYRVRDEIARSWLRRLPTPPDGRGFVSGAAMLVKRAVFEELNGFDTGFFMFYEDIDFCLRANTAGYHTIVDQRWQVRHARRHSTRDRFGQALQWSYESALRFHAKHGHPVRAYRTYVTADSTLRAGYHALRRTGKAGDYVALARRAVRTREG